MKRSKKINPGGIAPRVLTYQSEAEDAIAALSRYVDRAKWWNTIEVQKILNGRTARKLEDNKNETGGKYLRAIVLETESQKVGDTVFGVVDVYAVIEAFNVTCPALAHAVKKALCPGERGDKSKVQDIKEAKDALVRAVDMEIARKCLNHNKSQDNIE